MDRGGSRTPKVFGPHPRDAFVSGEVMRLIAPPNSPHRQANVLTMAQVKAAAQQYLIASGVDPRGQSKVRTQDGTWVQRLVEAGLLRPDRSVLVFLDPRDGNPIVRCCAGSPPRLVGRFRFDVDSEQLVVDVATAVAR